MGVRFGGKFGGNCAGSAWKDHCLPPALIHNTNILHELTRINSSLC